MTLNSKFAPVLAGILVGMAGALSAQAQTATVTFSVDMGTNIALGTFVPGTDTVSVRGTFDGWSAGGVTLYQEGSSTIYTNTAADASDSPGGILSYIFLKNGSSYEQTADYNNRAYRLPGTAGSTVVLPTPFYADSGAHITNNITFQVDMSQQVNTGAFIDGSSTVEVRGNFNGWAGGVDPLSLDSSIKVTNQYGLVTSEVYTGTVAVAASPNAAMDYKFVFSPPADSYEGVNATNQDGGGNRFFANTGDQTLPVVFFGDLPFAPTAQVTFNVDMTIVALTDTNFNPASVTINGDVMGWGGTAMTNDPTAANPNIYSATFTMGQGSPVNYQYRYTELTSGITVYDHANGASGGQGNRYYVVPSVGVTNIPAVYFNDASLSDYLTQPTPVLFTVDMTGAVTTDGHTFDPASDGLYINGQFANWYAWSGGVNPGPAPAGYQMFPVGTSMIYTNIIVMPAGTSISFAYKYGVDIGNLYGGPNDNEAGFGQNHYRVVRDTALNPYPLPQDKFGYQYGEPLFSGSATTNGNLTVGPVSNGKVAVSWLGRPGARLQTSSSLLGGWQTIDATDGTNWTSGYNGTNGFVSVTNWPAANSTFFRLIKQ